MGTRRPVGAAPSRSPKERAAAAKAVRTPVPLDCHCAWEAPVGRDPVGLLAEQAQTRAPDLVPIRHGRMLVSPFSYFRGAALPMAADLSGTPRSGTTVQLCGDAHLANFGFFGSPERHLFFDLNDFDETAPGPWEWDVKRLAASLEVAGRDNDFSTKQRRRIVRRCVRTYRRTVRQFAGTAMLDLWYAHLDLDDLLPRFEALLDEERTPSVWHSIATARAHDHLQAFGKLARSVDGEPRIVYDPPLIVPLDRLLGGAEVEADQVLEVLGQILRSYRRTLQPELRYLLEQYRFVDVARKVVGVGSVGTEAWIALLLDHDRASPLFLQVKEAECSVLERFTRKSAYPNCGQRVVVGQRMLQAASDIFLGWERVEWGGAHRDYYFRQLRDWKGSADIAGMTPEGMDLWGRMCGWTLARAHARTGDRIAIGAYLGKSDAFDVAVTAFSCAYADQVEEDHRALRHAVRSGRLTARAGL